MTDFVNHRTISQAHFDALRNELIKLSNTHNIYPIPSLKMSPHLQSANGMCRYKYRLEKRRLRLVNLDSIEILIATRLVNEFGLERAILTLRHEFAHAYCIHKYNDVSHSHQFREFCTAIGGSMNQHLAGTLYAEAASTDFIKPTMNWRYTCPCGCTHERRSRWPASSLYSRSCRKCGTRLLNWTLEQLT